MRSEGRCKNIKLKMQRYEFVVDAYVLALGGCDVVLGVQWLSALGTILWNFNELTMRFSHKDREVLLRGLVLTHLVHNSLQFRMQRGEQ